MLDQSMLDSLKGIFAQLTGNYTLSAATTNDKNGNDLSTMCRQMASVSEHIVAEVHPADRLSLTLLKDGKELGIVFRGIPGGHEFTSLLLAILNADGKGKNLPDELLAARIGALNTPLKLTTYASLTCTNCPDVVQSLNLIALYNQGITHEMVDGAIYKEEVERLDINAVPTVYANGELLHVGKSTLGELLAKLEEKIGAGKIDTLPSAAKQYDLVVVGGGPAGTSAAIYSARKGLNVAVVAERIGGQVNETVGIENLPSVPQTTGAELAAALKTHAQTYNITLLEQRLVEAIREEDGGFVLSTSLGEELKTSQVIIATGAQWRKLGVEGEDRYIGRGVAFCPHCDGPFFKDRRVAVVGGGNSGIEAAIDLAGICSYVTVLEFMPELKADVVLQQKVRSLPNVEVFTNVATEEIVGDGSKVTGIRVKDRNTNHTRTIDLDGVFVQIGLAANSAVFASMVETNRVGEIVVDERCRTSKAGVYAAGDCTTVPYKQIVIAMGEGAKASLTAFDDRIRNER